MIRVSKTFKLFPANIPTENGPVKKNVFEKSIPTTKPTIQLITPL